MKLKSLLCMITLTFSIFANAACERQIRKADGYGVSTKVADVMESINDVNDDAPSKKEYWLRKSQSVDLITFKTNTDSEWGGAEFLNILDPKTCKTLAILRISSWK